MHNGVVGVQWESSGSGRALLYKGSEKPVNHESELKGKAENGVQSLDPVIPDAAATRSGNN
jgi:hypothetical protein